MDVKDHLRSLGDAGSAPPSPRFSGSRTPAPLQGIETSVVSIAADDKGGKGFIIDGEGKIATNFHLVDAASRIKVTMLSGDVFLGKVVRTDPNRDLALIQIATKTTSYLQLGDSSSVDVGEEVYVPGRQAGAGASNELTRGIINALRRINGMAMIQMDIPIDSGQSGAPVLSSQGVVVGISTSRTGQPAADNTGFALSVTELKAFVFGQ